MDTTQTRATLGNENVQDLYISSFNVLPKNGISGPRHKPPASEEYEAYALLRKRMAGIPVSSLGIYKEIRQVPACLEGSAFH